MYNDPPPHGPDKVAHGLAHSHHGGLQVGHGVAILALLVKDDQFADLENEFNFESVFLEC